MMRNLLLIIKEDFINLVKNPMWIFYATFFPVLLVVILGFLTKDNYGNGHTSYDYYVITLMLYTILQSGMTSANAFMEERIKKPNMRIIYAPGSVKSIYLSKIISTFVFCLLFHLLDMLFLCLVYNVHLAAYAQVFVLFMLTELFSVTLGVMMCCIFKKESITNQLLSIVINLIAVFGGLLFSLDGYGGVIRKISMMSPAKWISDALFQMIYDANYSKFLPGVVILCALVAIMLGVCHITFRKEDCIC